MSDLVAFLTARLDEDEAALRQVIEAGAERGGLLINEWGHEISLPPPCDPARVLREVEAKRKILAEHEDTRRGYVIDHGLSELMCVRCADSDRDGEPYAEEPYPCPTLRALAPVYSDHPDYDAAWRP